MTATTRMLLLGAALIPYAALAGIDAWMHERHRRVPRLEQGLHAMGAVAFLVFVLAAFRDAGTVALASLVIFAVVTTWDEIGFHGGLAVRERRVHFAAYAALSVFVAAWALLGSVA